MWAFIMFMFQIIRYFSSITGRHRINIHYADVDIIGSPFLPEVYNARAVKMKPVATGFFGNPVNFEGNIF